MVDTAATPPPYDLTVVDLEDELPMDIFHIALELLDDLDDDDDDDELDLKMLLLPELTLPELLLLLLLLELLELLLLLDPLLLLPRPPPPPPFRLHSFWRSSDGELRKGMNMIRKRGSKRKKKMDASSQE